MLIVDDDQGTRIMLRQLLMQIDPFLRIRCVVTAEEAYSALNEAKDLGDPYDFVIADLCLPQSDGLMLWERARHHHPKVDFLFISGSTFKVWLDRTSSIRQNLNFIRKPITEEALRTYWRLRYYGAGLPRV